MIPLAIVRSSNGTWHNAIHHVPMARYVFQWGELEELLP